MIRRAAIFFLLLSVAVGIAAIGDVVPTASAVPFPLDAPFTVEPAVISPLRPTRVHLNGGPFRPGDRVALFDGGPYEIAVDNTNQSVRRIEVQGRYGYVLANNEGLQIYDLGDPRRPRPLARFDAPGLSARAAAVDGDHVFVYGSREGLLVIDVSDPYAPFQAGSYPARLSFGEVHVDGDLLYLADRDLGLVILDIRDPANPTEISRYTDLEYARDVAIWKQHAIVANFWFGIVVLDVSDPANPRRVASLDTQFDRATNIAVHEGFAYVAMGHDGYRIYDVRDPESPAEVAVLSPPSSVWSTRFHEDTALIADYGAGVLYLDVADPLEPRLVSIAKGRGKTVDMVRLDDVLLATNQSEGLLVLGDAGLRPPSPAALVATPDDTWSLSVSGGRMFVGGGRAGLEVYDVRDPFRPVLQGRLDTPFVAYDAVGHGDLVYVADGSRGIPVADVSSPTGPVHLRTFEFEDYTYLWDVDVAADRLYAQASSVLSILSLEDPTDPVLLGQWPTLGASLAVEVAGELAYVAGFYDGLVILDVRDPARPTPIGRYSTPTLWVRDIALQDHLAYVSVYRDGLVVLDVTDPTDPTPIGAFEVLDRAEGVAVQGDRAYVADHAGWLHELDVSDPTRPIPIGRYAIPLEALHVEIEDGFAFVTDENAHIVKLNPGLEAVERPSAERLSFTVPAGYTPGHYDVTVIHSDGSRDIVRNGLLVCTPRSGEARLFRRTLPGVGRIAPEVDVCPSAPGRD